MWQKQTAVRGEGELIFNSAYGQALACFCVIDADGYFILARWDVREGKVDFVGYKFAVHPECGGQAPRFGHGVDLGHYFSCLRVVDMHEEFVGGSRAFLGQPVEREGKVRGILPQFVGQKAQFPAEEHIGRRGICGSNGAGTVVDLAEIDGPGERAVLSLLIKQQG